MSYDIDIYATDPENKVRESYDPTYNYGARFRSLFGERGIDIFDGMSCSDALPELEAAIGLLKHTSEEDNRRVEEAWLTSQGYFGWHRESSRSWAPSDRNVAKALEVIAEGCRRWPHGTIKTR